MRYAVGMCSGGFDPIHKGHIRYIKQSMELCDQLIVVVNNDKWLVRKKGYFFMSFTERIEILKAIVRPTDIVCVQHADEDTVEQDIKLLHPNVFFKGGDRVLSSIPATEIKAAERAGCIIITNVGGKKVQSSSRLVSVVKKYE